ncbi:MAG: O-antigen ligase family protein [Cocleimonas sp.]
MIIRVLALLFVLSIFVPVEFHYLVGSLRLESYRVVLALVLIYTFVNIRNVLKQADLIDILLFFFVILASASLIYNHGLQKGIESAGILIIEILGAFYLARLFITTPKNYYQVNMWFVTILAFLLIFSLYEAFARDRILHQWAKAITGHDALDYRLYTHYYIRLGIMRTTNLFSHPILYGTIGAIFLPFIVLLTFYKFNLNNALKAIAVFIGIITTLSSAPILAIGFQSMTAVLVRFWSGAKLFWYGIAGLILAGMILIEAFSNRGVFKLIVSHMTFNANTGYYRLLQWQYTMDDIADHPLFGIGLNDWTRPSWLNNSIDSFWLLMTLQHGLIASFILFFLCLYAVFHILNRVHKHHTASQWMVKSWILAFMSLILIGFTVDFFGKIQPMFFFVLGAIGWAKTYPSLNLILNKMTLHYKRKNT